MKRYMKARKADDLCGAVNPEKSSAKCILPNGHRGRFHRSFTTSWQVTE